MKHRGTWVRRGACALTLIGSVALAGAPQAGAVTLGRLAVVARDFRFSGVPTSLAAGTRPVNFINVSKDEFHVFLSVGLGPKCSSYTKAEAIAELDKVGGAPDPGAAFAADCPGGGLDGDAGAPPGGRVTQDYSYAPGRHLYFCPVTTDSGVPHYKLGMIGFLNAKVK
jgi:hypothetical protein